MGQLTMTLAEAADVSELPAAVLAAEAFDGRLVLHPLPTCPECGEDGPCKATCSLADCQTVWIGDWFQWYQRRSGALKAEVSAP